MKKYLIILIVLCAALSTYAQNMVITKTGKISFLGRSTVEKIAAVNNEASSIINTTTGDVVFAVLMNGFHFERALMEEHFNENYVESTKYPKATFKGKIANTVNYAKDGQYPVTVSGDLSIHGVTKQVSVPATITVTGGKVAATCKFSVKIKDYNISIPSLVADKVSNDVDIIVDCKYDKK